MGHELVKAFTNDKFGDVRVVLVGANKEPYFVGKDVAECLGYKNVSDAIATHVDEEDKVQIAFNDLKKCGLEGKFGTKGTPVINESGLYSLILSSELPTSKEFKRWVTSEVLPSIRKTGSYSSSPMTMEDIIIYQMEQAKAIKSQLDNRYLFLYVES